MPRSPLAATVNRGLVILAVLAGFGAILGCDDTQLGSDLGLVTAVCRTPSSCYKVGVDCDCRRASVETVCKVCDPNLVDCTCNTPEIGTSQCVEGPDVCIGRAPATCTGIGARCLPAGSSCSTSGGDPPDLVGTGASGMIDPRCSFVDDVCCPGASVDMGADLSAAAGDLAVVD